MLSTPGSKGNTNQNHVSTSLRLECLPSRTQAQQMLQGCGQKKRTLIHCWWKCKLVQPLWKTL
jgi:hypothetical protein